MKTSIKHNNKVFITDLSEPIDISIAIRNGDENLSAWYVGVPEISPVIDGDFVGSVKKGASVNFNSIKFNPHAHGTHTECLGHITETSYSVNQLLKQYFFTARLISLAPENKDDDKVITRSQLKKALENVETEALIIRTLPNEENKKQRHYSHTNPPYLSGPAAEFIREKGIKHLLVDLPSVDKERDEGRLVAHKAFWDVEGNPRLDATITEFVFVPDQVIDGNYLLNLQTAAFENDAAPSRPLLYKILTHESNH
ncbi:cyclase family protein [Robertkochia aurantiaca]|uniref:cyclase family protein n=1 Tax=Robertkochia aurantiaca TaxID=2873700 RepID=UPI001CD04024|nr:cyclase family protein [Robertkochia sp. 3YJGBD-33]